MGYQNKNFQNHKQGQKPSNPLFLKVFEKMTTSGELKGLSDDAALEKVVSYTERLVNALNKGK